MASAGPEVRKSQTGKAPCTPRALGVYGTFIQGYIKLSPSMSRAWRGRGQGAGPFVVKVVCLVLGRGLGFRALGLGVGFRGLGFCG